MPFIKLNDLPSYSFLDPASGRKAKTQAIKNTRSRSALVTVKAEREMGRVYVVDVWSARVPPSAIMNEVIKVHQKWNPLIGIESSGQQYLFAETVGVGIRLQGYSIRWMPVDQPTSIHKDDRIRNTIQPLMDAGRLFIPEREAQVWVNDLWDELEGFPTARTRDIVDALASVIYHLVPPPQPKKNEKAELKELELYLRSQHFSAGYIEERLGQAMLN